MRPGAQLPSPEQAGQGNGDRPWCGLCGTDEYLIIEAVEPVPASGRSLLEISYTCAECDSYYGHRVRREQLDPRLLRGFPVLALASTDGADGAYLHCGELMTLGAPREQTITASMPADDDSSALLEVYLQTRVLHCRCGFQMEVPFSEAD
jgi:hypothetical protein